MMFIEAKTSLSFLF